MTSALDTFGCRMNTIKVAAGHYVCLKDPDPSTIELGSIAAALSKICRFGGHCPNFYSVAEHSVHATTLAKHDGQCLAAQRAVLLHDAAEAYLGDMVKPLKITMPEFQQIEDRMDRTIEKAFSVNLSTWRSVIKKYDRMMLKIEKVTMWPEDAEEWEGFGGIVTPDLTLDYLSPVKAERAFIEMASEIGM